MLSAFGAKGSGYMPSRKEVSSEMLRKGTQHLYQMLSDFYTYKTASSLSMLVLYFYEVSIVCFTLRYGKKKVANWKDVASKLQGDNIRALVQLRDIIAHEFLDIGNVFYLVHRYLTIMGAVNFKIIEKEIFGYDINLYENILSICEEKIN